MSSVNVLRKSPHVTHEGAPAKRINPTIQLSRTVMSCMLWEDNFYEDGKSVSDRIAELVKVVPENDIMDIAIEAREKMKLRHVPMLIAREMTRNKSKRVAELLERIIQRADELTEFLAIYWKDGRQKLSAQVKKGLRRAFLKFSEYDLAKYNLRDVAFLVHPKSPKGSPIDKMVNGTLEIPDTWEVALSAAKADEKLSVWSRLLSERKLGALALLRNLRNMKEAGVSEALVTSAIKDMKVERVLPFRFISAAKYWPSLEPAIEMAMMKCMNGIERASGKTILLVDASGSMNDKISGKSEMTRYDAACALAILSAEVFSEVKICAFNNRLDELPTRRGFALRDAFLKYGPTGGTALGESLKYLYAHDQFERIIVFTDEQTRDAIPGAGDKKGYMINIASNKNGVGYGSWNHIDGFSEHVLNYILELERSNDR